MKTGYFTITAISMLFGLAACMQKEVVTNDLLPEGTEVEEEEESEVEDPGYTYNEETKTYMVYNANGLLAWNKAVQDTLSLNFTLTADIDLTNIEYEWLLVGNNDDQYTGTFEGGGYTITGLTVNQEGAYYVGLIGYLGSDGKIQNLTLESMYITGEYSVGGVVGWNEGTVTDCIASGSVSGTSSRVGGVVGTNQGTVISCTSSGSVSGSSTNVGGVVGYNSETVTACTSSSNISGDSNNVGGVVGYNSDGTVTACYHTSGSVSGSSYVGGVAGWNNYGSLIACYHASGGLSGSNYIGGVAGRVLGGSMKSCYWSDYNGEGIGYGIGSNTKVDGTTVTWENAVDSMNSAISTSGWQYELTGDLPTLTKNNE